MAQLEDGQHYQAIPIRWEAVESKTSAAFGIRFTFIATHYAGTNGQWIELGPPLPQIEGTQWIMDKQGEARHDVIENLKIATAWDGATDKGFSQLAGDEVWEATPCEIVVGKETYKNKDRLRVEWVNPLNVKPGAKPISEANKARLRSKFLNAVTKPPKPTDDGKGPLAGGEIPF